MTVFFCLIRLRWFCGKPFQWKDMNSSWITIFFNLITFTHQFTILINLLSVEYFHISSSNRSLTLLDFHWDTLMRQHLLQASQRRVCYKITLSQRKYLACMQLQLIFVFIILFLNRYELIQPVSIFFLIHFRFEIAYFKQNWTLTFDTGLTHIIYYIIFS